MDSWSIESPKVGAVLSGTVTFTIHVPEGKKILKGGVKAFFSNPKIRSHRYPIMVSSRTAAFSVDTRKFQNALLRVQIGADDGSTYWANFGGMYSVQN